MNTRYFTYVKNIYENIFGIFVVCLYCVNFENSIRSLSSMFNKCFKKSLKVKSFLFLTQAGNDAA
jgi:hypothetical protein